jgi:outer membrane lipopolysaccharide assembly protein LptE/RlpB
VDYLFVERGGRGCGLWALFVILFLGFLTLSSGCGYQVAGKATHLPPMVSTLAVPVFATHVQTFHAEMSFTQAVIRELNTRTSYHILNKEDADADATLRGTILGQTVAPLTFDAVSGETSSYLVTITAKVVLTDHGGRVLYENPALSYHEQYQSTADLSSFIQEGSPAVTRISRDFARAVVSDMLESF